MKRRQVGAESFTDMTQIIVAFHNFTNAPI